MTLAIRRKVFVIPYYNDKVMLVKDRKTREWGFVSGGVKKHESYLKAAERELFEETSGLMGVIPKNAGVYSFNTEYRPEELLIQNQQKGEKVLSKYKVYWVPIGKEFAEHITKRFVPNEEVSAIRVDKYYSFKNRWIVCDMYMDTIQ